eukprot:4368776-Pyramimonas_sp.AAC.1
MAAMKSVQGHSASLLVSSRNVPKLKRSEEGGGQENRVISNARSSAPSPTDIEFVSFGFQKVFGVSNHNPVGGKSGGGRPTFRILQGGVGSTAPVVQTSP